MKIKIFAGLAVLTVFFALSCESPANSREDEVAFTGLSADGSADLTTSKLVLTFDKDISGLTAADVFLSAGNTGAVKGALIRTVTGRYELSLNGITAGGTVSVSVSKSGYTITGGSKSVTVYYYSSGNNNTGYDMTGTYTFYVNGNECTWIFTDDGNYQCTGYNIIGTKSGTWSSSGNDITISYSSSYVSGEEVFTVQESGGQVILTLKDNSTQASLLLVSFGLASKTVSLTKEADISVAFYDLTADGSPTGTTTTLTLTFDDDITGLTAADITLNAGSTGAVKGALTRTGTGMYDLAVSNITAEGTVSVSVSKSGYTITGGSKETWVYYYSSGNNNTDYNMTGTYTFYVNSNECTWVFSNNGNYQCTGYNIVGTKSGTWSSSDNEVTISYSSGSGSISVSGEEVFTVQESGGQVILTLKDNSTQVSLLLVSFGIADKTISLTKKVNIPVANDFNIGNLTQTVGSVTAVTITRKADKSNGYITIYYDGSTALPTAIGTYSVTFNVAAASGWDAASGLYAGTLTIQEPIDPVAYDFYISETSHTYDGTAKSVTITPMTGRSQGSITVYYDNGAALPINAGTYTVTFDVGQAPGYNAVTKLSGGTLTISPKSVTITGLEAADKVYDGSADAAVTGTAAVSGNVDGANLTVVGGTAAFVNKNTGNSKMVTFNGYTLGGTAANNYELSAQPTSVTANITPLLLTIAVPTGSPTKVYDGTTAYTGDGITIGSLTNIVNGDTVSASIASAVYNNANAADENQITIVYAISGEDSANYLAPEDGTITATITKAAGATVSAPTALSTVYNRITINAVTAPVNGQTVEYAISTASDETGLSAWQSGTVFTGLNVNTTYYVYARSAQSDNYDEGTASVSDAITTSQSGTAKVVAYYWVNEQDVLATTDSTGNGAITLTPGQELTITAQGAGYTNQQWHLNGVPTGKTGSVYTFSSTVAGKYTVGLFVEKGGKYYNANFTITVEE